MSQKESKENPLVDIGSTTISAFNIIKNQEDSSKEVILGRDDTKNNTPNHKVRVKVYTPADKQEHTYFHSLSIDKEVTDFMGTAELKCPYDSDLMEYWEPARAYCVVYGTNKGDYKILFVGRVREVRQVGYEMSIVLQDYGWKFKQMVTQSYADDNVIDKDGYTIMKLMFSALKIDSWVISPAAKSRLQQVGIDSDGNLTLNKKKVEEMPDLIERLKKSDPNKAINKYTIYNKVKESELHNIKNINYTLKYEKPTKRMKKIASQGSYESGDNIYANAYGSSSATSNGDSSSEGGVDSSLYNASGHPRPPSDLCSYIGDSAVISAMKLIWAYNRGYANEWAAAKSTIVNFASNHPATYSSKAAPCLSTLAKYCSRKDGNNIAITIKSAADSAATISGGVKTVSSVASSAYNTASSFIKRGVSAAVSTASHIVSGVTSAIKSGYSAVTSAISSIFR